MDTALITLTALALPDPTGGDLVPDWIHLVPKGRFQSSDGRGPWSYADAKAVIEESFARRRRIHIDENHSTDTAAKVGLSAPARGFIVEMEERPDGIWGRVDWNESGKALLSDRAYWGVSPVLSYDKKTGAVRAIARAALTNDPALRELLALNSTEPQMDRSKLAKMLGLAEDASEAEIETALSARLGGGEAGGEELTTSLSQIGKAMGIEGDVSLTTILSAARAFKSARDEQAEQVTALQARVKDLEDGDKRRAAEAFVDGAIRDQRHGVKPERETWILLHMEKPEWVEKMIGSFSKIVPTNTTIQPPTPPEGQAALSADQASVAKMLGIDPADMAKNLQETI